MADPRSLQRHMTSSFLVAGLNGHIFGRSITITPPSVMFIAFMLVKKTQKKIKTGLDRANQHPHGRGFRAGSHLR